jgi:hypothetical protein
MSKRAIYASARSLCERSAWCHAPTLAFFYPWSKLLSSSFPTLSFFIISYPLKARPGGPSLFSGGKGNGPTQRIGPSHSSSVSGPSSNRRPTTEPIDHHTTADCADAAAAGHDACDPPLRSWQSRR